MENGFISTPESNSTNCFKEKERLQKEKQGFSEEVCASKGRTRMFCVPFAELQIEVCKNASLGASGLIVNEGKGKTLEAARMRSIFPDSNITMRGARLRTQADELLWTLARYQSSVVKPFPTFGAVEKGSVSSAP